MLRKYIPVITLAALLALIVMAGHAMAADHPDKCVACHGDDATVSETIGGTTYDFWSHNVSTKEPWGFCTNCHSQIGAKLSDTQNAHSQIGCKCHAVVHKGATVTSGTTTKWLAVIFYYEPNTKEDIVKPTPNAIQRFTAAYDEANYTSFTNGTYLNTLNEREIEVLLWDSLTNSLVSPSGSGTAATNVQWSTCFSCHFLAVNATQVGAFQFVDGTWKIGIPESALTLPAHEITGVKLASAAGGEGGAPLAPVALSMGVGLLGAALVIFKRK